MFQPIILAITKLWTSFVEFECCYTVHDAQSRQLQRAGCLLSGNFSYQHSGLAASRALVRLELGLSRATTLRS